MVETGLERFLARGGYERRSIALIANQTSVTRDLAYGWDALLGGGYRLRRIFSPEHGLFATEQDQAPVGRQPGIGTEVVSLYGENQDTLVPDPSLLRDIDLVLFDIQDVGARYYTYVNTLVLFMKLIDRTGLELMVLDRPNPVGGEDVEGPLLDPGYESFVGVLPVSVRHGLTAGEIAQMARVHLGLDLPLTVCSMTGWTRGMQYAESGLPWIPPSPNMPDIETALCYPGFCLFEALNVSEGRGTTVPFRVVGAPFIDPHRLAGLANSLELPGVLFRPTWFRPTFNKFAGETIGGVFVHVTDRATFRSFLSAASLIACLQELYPSDLEFLHGVYEFNTLHPAFDLLAGSDRLRRAILNGTAPGGLAGLWEGEESRFSEERRRYFIYHD